jgi:hypothetical protein
VMRSTSTVSTTRRYSKGSGLRRGPLKFGGEANLFDEMPLASTRYNSTTTACFTSAGVHFMIHVIVFCMDEWKPLHVRHHQ